MTGNPPSGSTRAHAVPIREYGFFGVLACRQSYFNIAYLFLSFPLGIVTFTLLVTGLAVGFGLAILGIGLLILLLMMVVIRALASWERQLNILLLGANIPPPDPNPTVWKHPLIALKRFLTDAYSWKCLAYFVVKFPLAILSFVVLVLFVSVTLSLLLAPLLYPFVPFQVLHWRIVSAEGALISALVGLCFGLLGFHVINGLAAVSRALATALLSGSAHAHPDLKPGPVIIP